MNISLPDDMKAFVDEQVRLKGYSSSSEYIRSLIRRQRDDIEELRAKIIEGMESGDPQPADDAYFERLRARVKAVSA